VEAKLGKLTRQFDDALEDFNAALAIDTGRFDEQTTDVLKNGQVQKFEFTTELLWKMLKAFLLEQHGIDAASPKQVIRRYFELDFCTYEESEALLEAIDLRNTLSHVYNKETFEKIYAQVQDFGPILEQIFKKRPWEK